MQDIWGSSPIRTQSPETVRLLFLIAWLILLIAVVNYMNFSTALTPMRIRSINTQKVLGSPVGALRLSLLVEAAAICLMAYLLALVWVYLLDRGQYLSFVEADIRLLPNLSIVLGTGAIAFLVGVLAGVYPAYYITSFPPALVLKGSFGLSQNGVDRFPVYRLRRSDCRGMYHSVTELFHAPLCARLRPGSDFDYRAQPGFMHQA